MSRCFPFPPPGYEKKVTIDDIDLLAKETRKEKKHKGDKKDKEKKEGKEKKNKDRIKEKHSEKKDRKKKHKEKEKDREKEKAKEKRQVYDEQRLEGQSEFHNGEKFSSNSMPDKDINDSKYVHELVKRIREEDRVSGSQMLHKIPEAEQRRVEVQGWALDNLYLDQLEEQQKLKDKNEDRSKVSGQRNHNDAGGVENTFGQSFSGMGQERVEGITKLVEKDTEKEIERKEKSKHKENDNKGDKHKCRDPEKDRKAKNKKRDKEKKKEAKVREVSEPTNDQAKFKASSPLLKGSSKDSLDFRISRSSDPARLGSTNSTVEENLGKRKEVEINGYLPGNGERPNKLARPVSSSNLVIENGNKLEQCQTSIPTTSEKQGLVDNHRSNVMDRKINGFLTPLQTNDCKIRQSSANAPANENGEVYQKPPHPDLKYLNQILSVPKMDEWPDYCDQEWLLSSDHKSKKLETGSSVTNGAIQVWAEARQKCADIVALPYVIPY
ncbi:hypothetical protein K2173_018326 [Erythroxylum novogranatense]|uniref:Uncharacterized protein n=1 Tax=Erythroxylum novogranatense TaxID=1862640 RepID=A0AAV8UDF2_9ROSI|nr:hypothetical protein K2173_018326 [Erythroxylum novogranatense]